MHLEQEDPSSVIRWHSGVTWGGSLLPLFGPRGDIKWYRPSRLCRRRSGAASQSKPVVSAGNQAPQSYLIGRVLFTCGLSAT